MWKVGSEEIAQALLEYFADPNADPNARDSYHQSPLHEGCEWGRPCIVLVLHAENGPDEKAQDSKCRIPLGMAPREGCLNFVRLILQRCADIHAWHDKGRLSFLVASASKHHDVMQLLLENKDTADGHRTRGLSAQIAQTPCAWSNMISYSIGFHNAFITVKPA